LIRYTFARPFTDYALRITSSTGFFNMNSTFDLLKRLTEAPGIAGNEEAVRDLYIEIVTPLVDEVRTDRVGNVIARKRGSGDGSQSVMIAAHMDEIGLMVTHLEKGFVRFTDVGGVDWKILPSQEVVVHGRRALPGIVASRPPHVLPADQRGKPIGKDHLFIDVGFTAEEVSQVVQVGDFITIDRTTQQLNDKFATGKALDNRASMTAMLLAMQYLQSVEHTWDIYAVATVQEENGLRGAITSTFGIQPTLGIALDVTFARQPGASEEETVEWDKGPTIGLGPNMHPLLHKRLVETAKASEIPHIIEVLPGDSGTDAWPMQVTQAGIPTGLLSIPIRNMHTPAETVVLKDIERTARLLASFVAGLDGETMAGLRLE
jgi:tetrahedral aminopeptidase